MMDAYSHCLPVRGKMLVLLASIHSDKLTYPAFCTSLRQYIAIAVEHCTGKSDMTVSVARRVQGFRK